MSLDNMKKRMLWEGGGKKTSDGRNVKGKLLSFRSALDNSYQAENIIFKRKRCRCLINPDKIKENYDQKEISIDFSAGMKNGDVFYWHRNKTHWLVYLQRHEEEAYFRAQVRRCDYQLDVNNHKYWIYLRGTVETALIWRQKYQTELNDMNYSMLMYITKNEETLEFFERFKIIKFDGHNWRVSAVDRYSQDGVIEIYVEEYFDNEMEEAMVIPEVIKPDVTKPYIDGPQIVHAWDTDLAYAVVNADGGKFVVNSGKVNLKDLEDGTCEITISTGKSTEFTLTYEIDENNKIELPIKVQPL